MTKRQLKAWVSDMLKKSNIAIAKNDQQLG